MVLGVGRWAKGLSGFLPPCTTHVYHADRDTIDLFFSGRGSPVAAGMWHPGAPYAGVRYVAVAIPGPARHFQGLGGVQWISH